MISLHKIRWRNMAALGAGVYVLAACATSGTVPKTAAVHIEIQEQVGFTITEEARVAMHALFNL
jgi:hypothetical protein